ncbi:MAG: hypothetical protein Fur0042_22120 [Cyanophyceae cyanobacterium]
MHHYHRKLTTQRRLLQIVGLTTLGLFPLMTLASCDRLSSLGRGPADPANSPVDATDSAAAPTAAPQQEGQGPQVTPTADAKAADAKAADAKAADASPAETATALAPSEGSAPLSPDAVQRNR